MSTPRDGSDEPREKDDVERLFLQFSGSGHERIELLAGIALAVCGCDRGALRFVLVF
jgi:hypothetical protein